MLFSIAPENPSPFAVERLASADPKLEKLRLFHLWASDKLTPVP